MVISSRAFFFSVELIDTLWNVNDITVQRNQRVRRELIDTLWNLNIKAGGFEVSAVEN